jgi:hypothetical protein
MCLKRWLASRVRTDLVLSESGFPSGGIEFDHVEIKNVSIMSSMGTMLPAFSDPTTLHNPEITEKDWLPEGGEFAESIPAEK